MAAVNYAESYQKALANTYGYAMYMGELFTTPNNALYRVTDAKTIRIPKVTTTGRVDGTRDMIGSFARHADNDWENKELTNHRAWNTLVHPQDIAQTGGVLAIQNITKHFNEFQKIPEKQAYAVSKIYADYTAAGGAGDATTITASDIIDFLDRKKEEFAEARIPAGTMVYVTPEYKRILKKAVARYFGNGESALDRDVENFDGWKIKEVPKALMKTVYDFTEGFKPGVGAKQINMFFVHPLSVLTPENYTFVGLQEPTTLTQGKWAYFEEAFEDAFILNERKGGISFHISEVAA